MHLQYRLRTLLIVLALGPPALAVLWLWILPLAPKSFGDAVVIGSLDGMAVLLALVVLQFGWTLIASRWASHN
jgi:hypothetical protein